MILKSINYWSFPGGLEGTLEPIDAMRLAKEHRFDAIELGISESGPLGLDVSDSKLKDIKEESQALGLPIPSVASGLYWSRSLGDGDSGQRQLAREDLERMIEIAAILGAQTLLTIPGAVEVFFLPEREILSYDHVWRHATEGLKAVLLTAERHNIRLGIENVWNKFLLSPIEMATFIDQFQSPLIGAYVDVANVMPYGYPDQWLRILGQRVVGVHFKDFRKAVGTVEGFVDLLEGDVNWPAVMSALRDIAYKGPIPAEMIPGYQHHPMVRIGNTSNAMDAILAN